MRTTIDIPDALHEALRAEAKQRGTTLNALIVSRVQGAKAPAQAAKRRVQLPLIESKRPGWLKLTNKKIAELVPFP